MTANPTHPGGLIPPTDQEPDMTAKDRHDELVALLTEIRDTLLATSGAKPKPRKPMPDLTPEQERRIARAPKQPWTPPNDLPGEPVKPGDLRAGDKVAFDWEVTGERIACTLVSHPKDDALCSDAAASDGYSPNVVFHREWDSGISDVRLIERAPREDEDPDEALAKTYERAERAERACKTLGKVVEDQCRDALDATGLHHLIGEDGDGDWMAVWENLAELRPRAEAAEADRARVTEERDTLRDRVDELLRERQGFIRERDERGRA